MADPPPAAPVIATNLASAMVKASDAPLLLLDSGLRVVAVSRSFCDTFGIASDGILGGPVRDMGAGEWNLPKLDLLLEATLSGAAEVEAYDMDLMIAGEAPRQVVIKARLLDYGATSAPRLLVTVVDVTDARIAERLKDDLIREKAVLLQEVQHRVANSLQIIASLLLQSARNVQSEETRVHLRDAHNRVMSIATVQKQLVSATHEDVELRSYFTELCASLGASMIMDPSTQFIRVTADTSRVVADVSISLGLIVTELVINALKHAFPHNRPGLITVDYLANGLDWTLVVSDNGVGMPEVRSKAVPGLGTSIVEALARQLHAQVQVTDSHPGAKVTVAHTETGCADDPVAADAAL
jgi:two-component sensor histidine kinase